ncbi:flagellar hook-associated protein 2 [Sesbania bispinosa]|nr:flagellar hook-associated protein 2 [Sesbania bispinosa]
MSQKNDNNYIEVVSTVHDSASQLCTVNKGRSPLLGSPTMTIHNDVVDIKRQR